MSPKIPLAAVGFAVLLVVGLTIQPLIAQVQTTASAGDATATAQTSPNPSVVPEGVTADVPASVSPPSVGQYVTMEMRIPQRPWRANNSQTPAMIVVVVPPQVTHYRRLYATPLRDILFGHYRTVVTPAWYPLRQ